MVIAKANNYTVWTGDIKNTYLYAECDTNVCTMVGPEFELARYTSIKDGLMARVVKYCMAYHQAGAIGIFSWLGHLGCLDSNHQGLIKMSS